MRLTFTHVVLPLLILAILTAPSLRAQAPSGTATERFGALQRLTAQANAALERGDTEAAKRLLADVSLGISRLRASFDPKLRAEDCIDFLPATLRVIDAQDRWTVQSSYSTVFSFPTQDDAQRAESTILHYGVDRTCYVGRPHAPMMYFLKGVAPTAGSVPAE